MITLEQDWKQWVKELESDKYKQRRLVLGSIETGLCCLGVRCLMHNVEFFSNDKLPDFDVFHMRNPTILGFSASHWNDVANLSFMEIAQKIKDHAAAKGWT